MLWIWLLSRRTVTSNEKKHREQRKDTLQNNKSNNDTGKTWNARTPLTAVLFSFIIYFFYQWQQCTTFSGRISRSTMGFRVVKLFGGGRSLTRDLQVEILRRWLLGQRQLFIASNHRPVIDKRMSLWLYKCFQSLIRKDTVHKQLRYFMTKYTKRRSSPEDDQHN